jgi:hypothetical protein
MPPRLRPRAVAAALLVLTPVLSIPALAQTPGGGVPQARRVVFSVGTTSLPWRESGLGASAEVRVSRFLTMGVAGSAGTIGSNGFGERYGDSRAFEGRATWYPQGNALRGWQVTAGVGQQRFGPTQTCATLVGGGTQQPETRCFDFSESRTTLGLQGGHQWLLGSTGRWTAGASAGVRTSLGDAWAGQWRTERLQGVMSLRVGFAL